MEEADHRSLDNPQEYILDKGGHLFVAILNDEVVGVRALMVMHGGEHDFELAKMAVSPSAQGKSISWLLGQAALNNAASLGVAKLYLESDTILKPAISFYHKLGFQKIAGHPTPYERCNIHVTVDINHFIKS